MVSDNLQDYFEENVENFADIINRHRVDLVKYIDFDRQLILTYLQSKNIIDEEDIYIIKGAGPSRQQQVSKFLDVLARTGACGYKGFLEVLEMENADLFKLITNKKALKRFNLDSPSSTKPYSVLTDQQFVDHERRYLATELEKCVGTNYKMSHMQSKLTKEKCFLQEENEKLKQIISEKNLQIEELETDLRNQKNILSFKSDKNNNLDEYLLKAQQLLKENAEKSQLIIQYQAKIMAMRDEQDLLNKELTELKLKNSNLLQKMNYLKNDYNFQRSCSERLSEQVDQSKDELKQVRSTNKKLVGLQFELARVTEEKDEALHRVKEFRDVMTALNIKYDILRKEKSKEAEKCGQVSKEYAKLEEENEKMQLELKFELNKRDMVTRKNERLQQELSTFKEQCCFYLNERENVMRERDQLVKEYDDLRNYNRELQNSRDEAVNKQVAISELLEQTRKEFDARLHELSDTIIKLQEELQDTTAVKENQRDTINLSIINENDCEELFDIDIELSDFRKRRDTDLLQSARRKLRSSESNVQQKTKTHQILDCHEMMNVFDTLSCRKSPAADMFEVTSSLSFKSEECAATAIKKGDVVTKQDLEKPSQGCGRNTLYLHNSTKTDCQEIQSSIYSDPSVENSDNLKSDNSFQKRKLFRQFAQSNETRQSAGRGIYHNISAPLDLESNTRSLEKESERGELLRLNRRRSSAPNIKYKC